MSETGESFFEPCLRCGSKTTFMPLLTSPDSRAAHNSNRASRRTKLHASILQHWSAWPVVGAMAVGEHLSPDRPILEGGRALAEPDMEGR